MQVQGELPWADLVCCGGLPRADVVCRARSRCVGLVLKFWQRLWEGTGALPADVVGWAYGRCVGLVLKVARENFDSASSTSDAAWLNAEAT